MNDLNLVLPHHNSYTIESPVVKQEKSLSSKVQRITIIILKKIKAVLLFPFRYLGSKSWSIPGSLVRSPTFFFKDKTESFFESGYHYHPEKQLTPTELTKHLPYISTTAYVHRCGTHWISPYGYQALSPETLALEGVQFPKGLEARSSCFFDRQTGLKATIVGNENEIIVTFGALGSQNEIIKDEKESKQIRKKIIHNTCANIVGLTPRVYKQAYKTFCQMQKSTEFQGKKITLTGTCFGGSVAAYVALKAGVPALCINSAPLGVGLQTKIGEKKLAQADSLMTQINVTGDWMTGSTARGVIDRIVGLLGIRTPGNFGRKFSIPTCYKDSQSSHSYYMACIKAYLQTS